MKKRPIALRVKHMRTKHPGHLDLNMSCIWQARSCMCSQPHAVVFEVDSEASSRPLAMDKPMNVVQEWQNACPACMAGTNTDLLLTAASWALQRWAPEENYEKALQKSCLHS